MQQGVGQEGWRSLLRREWLPTLAVLLGGVLLQSMSVLMLTTVLPSIVGELGGVAMLSWPTTAFLASSIVAASCAGMLASAVGALGGLLRGGSIIRPWRAAVLASADHELDRRRPLDPGFWWRP
jgi:hypothetical protein